MTIPQLLAAFALASTLVGLGLGVAEAPPVALEPICCRETCTSECDGPTCELVCTCVSFEQSFFGCL
jgi:hypothetical protein